MRLKPLSSTELLDHLMEQYLKPGYRVRPKAEPPKPGRPKIKADEEALSLGEKRQRLCASKEKAAEKENMRDVMRRLELLEAAQAESTPDEKVQKMMSLHQQKDEEIKQLREALSKRRSGRSGTIIKYHSIPLKTIEYH